MNIEAIIRFADLDQKRKDLETELEAVKDQIRIIEDSALTEMADEGVAAVKVTRSDRKEVTVRVDRKIWASAKENHDAVAEEFRSMGMTEFVTTTVNGARLSSWVRETFDPDNCTSPDEISENLPEGLRGRLTISEVTKLRSR